MIVKWKTVLILLIREKIYTDGEEETLSFQKIEQIHNSYIEDTIGHCNKQFNDVNHNVTMQIMSLY